MDPIISTLAQLFFPDDVPLRRILNSELLKIWRRRPKTLASRCAESLIWLKILSCDDESEENEKLAAYAIVVFRVPIDIYSTIRVDGRLSSNPHVLESLLRTNISAYALVEFVLLDTQLIAYFCSKPVFILKNENSEEEYETKWLMVYTRIALENRVDRVCVQFVDPSRCSEKWQEFDGRLPLTSWRPAEDWRSAIDSKSVIIYEEKDSPDNPRFVGVELTIPDAYDPQREELYRVVLL